MASPSWPANASLSQAEPNISSSGRNGCLASTADRFRGPCGIVRSGTSPPGWLLIRPGGQRIQWILLVRRGSCYDRISRPDPPVEIQGLLCCISRTLGLPRGTRSQDASSMQPEQQDYSVHVGRPSTQHRPKDQRGRCSTPAGMKQPQIGHCLLGKTPLTDSWTN